MKKQLKTQPKFTNEAQERAFWEEHDSTDYVDWSKAAKCSPAQSKADNEDNLSTPAAASP